MNRQTEIGTAIVIEVHLHKRCQSKRSLKHMQMSFLWFHGKDIKIGCNTDMIWWINGLAKSWNDIIKPKGHAIFSWKRLNCALK